MRRPGQRIRQRRHPSGAIAPDGTLCEVCGSTAGAETAHECPTCGVWLIAVPRGYAVTYETITYESAEDGDTSDDGYVIDGFDCSFVGEHRDANIAYAREHAFIAIDADEDPVAWLIRMLRNNGHSNPSAAPWSPGCWYSQEHYVIDYATGEQRSESVHLHGEWTDDEQRAIYAAVVRR